jgi:hypothetical protein
MRWPTARAQGKEGQGLGLWRGAGRRPAAARQGPRPGHTAGGEQHARTPVRDRAEADSCRSGVPKAAQGWGLGPARVGAAVMVHGVTVAGNEDEGAVHGTSCRKRGRKDGESMKQAWI